MRKKIFAANWKMYKNTQEAKSFIEEFVHSFPIKLQKQVVIFPSTVLLSTVAETLKGSDVQWGAQNCYFEKEGAFTGETSVQTLSQMGAHFVLVGHSERRHVFGETNELIAKKVKAIQDQMMTPMLCVGETLAQRESNQTAQVITEQLKIGLSLADMAKPLVIAYEPVWAIGTGKVASPEQAEEAHQILREKLNDQTLILYGGSVKPENAGELSKKPNIDGFLVGGASLQTKSFTSIIQAGL